MSIAFAPRRKAWIVPRTFTAPRCDARFGSEADVRFAKCLVRVTPAGTDGLDWHPLSGLQQRLEIAKHPWPTATTFRGVAATRHHAGDHRRTSDVVSNSDRAHTALALVDLVRDARRRLRQEIRVEEWVPSLHKLSWGIAFNDFANDDLIRHSHRLPLSTGAMGEATAGLKFIAYAATIAMLLGPVGQSDRIPNRPSACIDNNAVELGCAGFVHRSHLRRLSNSVLIGLRGLLGGLRCKGRITQPFWIALALCRRFEHAFSQQCSTCHSSLLGSQLVPGVIKCFPQEGNSFRVKRHPLSAKHNHLLRVVERARNLWAHLDDSVASR